jgi:hypothetical protein
MTRPLALRLPKAPPLEKKPEVPAPDRGLLDLAGKTADELGVKLTELAKPMFAGLETLLGQLSDDLYNTAVLQNPAAHAFMHGSSQKALTDAKAVLLHDNRENETVVVYARGVNAANDVVGLVFSGGEGDGARAAVAADSVPGIAGAVLLRPNQKVYAAARGTYPITVHVTVIRLRGRAGIFGG